MIINLKRFEREYEVAAFIESCKVSHRVHYHVYLTYGLRLDDDVTQINTNTNKQTLTNKIETTHTHTNLGGKR